MEQTKALNALEVGNHMGSLDSFLKVTILTVTQPFLALAKSATSPRAAANLVSRATSAPNTFFFMELLQTPQIQALSSSEEFRPYLTLLQIFSQGTYSAYKATPNLPPLNDAQIVKLRQLSLLTHAKDRVLAYSDLISVLGLSSARELEEIVISSIYASLINATLDPVHETVQIHAVAPLRDVSPQAVPDLLTSLQSWSSACEDTLADLEAQIKAVRQKANIRAEKKASTDARLAKLVEDETNSISNELNQRFRHQGSSHQERLPARRSGATAHMIGSTTRYGKRGIGHIDTAPGAVNDEAMDLDDEDDADEKKKNSKRKLQG